MGPEPQNSGLIATQPYIYILVLLFKGGGTLKIIKMLKLSLKMEIWQVMLYDSNEATYKRAIGRLVTQKHRPFSSTEKLL